MIYERFNTESQGFKLWPTKAHGIITLSLSVAGIIFNSLTIAIFSQKIMKSVTNNILLGISVFDILLMSAYIPYSAYFYLLTIPDATPGQSAFWPYYALMHSHVTLFAHGCSVWYTCFLALYRYITVKSCVTRGGDNPIFNETRVRNVMIGLVVMVLMCMSFNVLGYGLAHSCFPFAHSNNSFNNNYTNNNNTLYPICTEDEVINAIGTDSNLLNKTQIVWLKLLWVQSSALAEKHQIVTSINFWLHAIVFRTVPCLILLILSILLILIMRIANMNRMKLMQQGRRSEYEKAGEFNRTTTMLLIVVISFLTMELPHGILYIICGISDKFFREVYVNLGDLLDVLVIINSSINFFLYCCMSSQFRNRFKEMFCSLCFKANRLKNQKTSLAPSIVNLKRMSRADNTSFKNKRNSINNKRKYLYALFNYKKSKQHTILIDNETQNLNSIQLHSREVSVNDTSNYYKEVPVRRNGSFCNLTINGNIPYKKSNNDGNNNNIVSNIKSNLLTVHTNGDRNVVRIASAEDISNCGEIHDENEVLNKK